MTFCAEYLFATVVFIHGYSKDTKFWKSARELALINETLIQAFSCKVHLCC